MHSYPYQQLTTKAARYLHACSTRTTPASRMPLRRLERSEVFSHLTAAGVGRGVSGSLLARLSEYRAVPGKPVAPHRHAGCCQRVPPALQRADPFGMLV